jgi:Methyladenine glycosylase
MSRLALLGDRVSTIPDQVENPGLSDYLEVMARAFFQAGLRWSAIAQHWDAFRESFDGFDCARVAAYTEGDIDRLMHAPGVLHSARKIDATIRNAQRIIELDRTHGTFAKYLRSFSSYDALAADIRKNFKFMGEMNAWYFLFRVREPVPHFDRWVKTIPGDHPRMREMVERARAAGTSTEV